MSQTNKPALQRWLLAAAVIVLALILRQISLPPDATKLPINLFLGLLRSLLYIGLIMAWGLSLRRRVIQKRLRRLLTAIVVLMLFWLCVRAVAYQINLFAQARRYLWYAFYPSMLLIPPFAFCAALRLSKGDEYRLPKWTRLLFVVSLLLILLVFTNDLHQWVFRFPDGAPFTVDRYSYSGGYFLVVAWIGLVSIAAILLILLRCRIPYVKKLVWLPFVPTSVLLVYTVLYALRVPFVMALFGDLTAFSCCMIAAIFESCLSSGIIGCNDNYGELFLLSPLAMQITDETHTVRYSTKNAKPMEPAALCKADDAPVLYANGLRLSAAAIHGGHCYRQEDVSELTALLDEQNRVREELQSYGALLQDKSKQKARREKLLAEQRLYAELNAETAPICAHLGALAGALQAAKTETEAKALLRQVTVVGAYRKRRSNLRLLAEGTDRVTVRELMLCLGESVMTLKLCHLCCALHFEGEGELTTKAALRLYDCFEAVAEACLDAACGLLVSLTVTGSDCELSMAVQGEAALDALEEQFVGCSVCAENELSYCRLCVKTEG